MTNVSSVVSTAPLKNQLETRLDNVQATIASLVDAPASRQPKRGRSKTDRRAAAGRQDNKPSRRERSASKGKSSSGGTRPVTCKYEHCMLPTTRQTVDCLFAKLAEKIGTDS